MLCRYTRRFPVYLTAYRFPQPAQLAINVFNLKTQKLFKATFIVEETGKIVKITLNKKFREILEEKKKEDKLNEAYAWELAEVPENQLFKITTE